MRTSNRSDFRHCSKKCRRNRLEPPCTDPYARWCGRGRRVTAAPMPIKRRSRKCRPSRNKSRPASPGPGIVSGCRMIRPERNFDGTANRRPRRRNRHRRSGSNPRREAHRCNHVHGPRCGAVWLGYVREPKGDGALCSVRLWARSRSNSGHALPGIVAGIQRNDGRADQLKNAAAPLLRAEVLEASVAQISGTLV